MTSGPLEPRIYPCLCCGTDTPVCVPRRRAAASLLFDQSDLSQPLTSWIRDAAPSLRSEAEKKSTLASNGARSLQSPVIQRPFADWQEDSHATWKTERQR